MYKYNKKIHPPTWEPPTFMIITVLYCSFFYLICAFPSLSFVVLFFPFLKVKKCNTSKKRFVTVFTNNTKHPWIIHPVKTPVSTNQTVFPSFQKTTTWTFVIIIPSSVSQSCPTLWDPMNFSTPSYIIFASCNIWPVFSSSYGMYYAISFYTRVLWYFILYS